MSAQSDFEHVPTLRCVETEYVYRNSKLEHLEQMPSENPAAQWLSMNSV